MTEIDRYDREEIDAAEIEEISPRQIRPRSSNIPSGVHWGIANPSIIQSQTCEIMLVHIWSSIFEEALYIRVKEGWEDTYA